MSSNHKVWYPLSYLWHIWKNTPTLVFVFTVWSSSSEDQDQVVSKCSEPSAQLPEQSITATNEWDFYMPYDTLNAPQFQSTEWEMLSMLNHKALVKYLQFKEH